MPKLVLPEETHASKDFAIPEGATTIGRSEEAGLVVAHASLSRLHARLERSGARVEIVDLGSKNGTWVNGVRVDRTALRAGDLVRMGDLDFAYLDDARAEARGPTRTVDVRTAFVRATDLAPRAPAGDARAAERLHVLLQVSQILSMPEPVEALLEKILDLAFRIFEVDRGAVLLKGAGGALEPRVVRTRSAAVPGERIWSQSIVDWVREHGVAGLFADARADPRIDPQRSIAAQSISASMCTPLTTPTATLGVLYVDMVSSRRILADDDLALFAGFANQAAVALENSSLHARLAEEAALRQSLVRFFPPATVDQILQAKGARLPVVEVEASALFCDISGYTERSSTMPPREVLALLDEFFPAMADVVFRHEGTLEKYIGDALLAVWGAPFAHEDDADRAVQAAIEMQRAVRDKTFGIHVGVHTGAVAAGNVGSDRYLQYATVGDTTNLASRLCGAAKDGEILVSDETAKRLRAAADRLEPLGPITVKGRSAPVVVHRVRWT